MKKFLAFALAALMIMAMVPATFAAPTEEEAESFDREANKAEAPFSQKAIDNDGNVVEVKGNTAKAITAEDVNPKYEAIHASSFESKGWMAETKRSGLQMVEQEESLLNGYWLDSDCFTLVNDWYTDGTEVLAQVIQPIDESGEYHEYMKGETFWMNYDLMKAWDDGSQSLQPLSKKVNVYYYVFAGTIDDFSGEGGAGIRMVNGWQTGDSSMGMKMIAPEDSYVYMFVVIVKDTTLNEFGAWVTPSSAETDNEFKAINEGAQMSVGKSVNTNTGKSGLVLMPVVDNHYRLAYGEKHAIELEGGKNYVAIFDSLDSIGIYVYFCDENMDIISSTYVGSGAIAQGHSYREYPLAIMPAVSGTYYIVTCGFYIGDKGDIEATVYNWNDVAQPLTDTTSSIDLNSLGTEQQVGPETGLSNQPYAWFYIWYPDYSVGELTFLYPGTYTLVGSNENIFVDVYDGVHLVLKDATIGSTWAANTYAPVNIESTGKKSAIANSSLEYSFYNYEGCNAGTYFTGDSITVTSSGNSQGAIYTDSCPMHVLTKTMEVYTTPHEGYYTIAIWTTGKENPQLTFGKDAQFDGNNQKATMYYDGDGNNVFGYAVSEHPEHYRVNNEPKLGETATEFKVTTAGTLPNPGPDDPTPTPPQPGEGILGDANLDGKLNTGDATTVLKYAAEMIQLSDEALRLANINGDDKVNTGDATYILKVVAEIIPDPNN